MTGVRCGISGGWDGRSGRVRRSGDDGGVQGVGADHDVHAQQSGDQCQDRSQKACSEEEPGYGRAWFHNSPSVRVPGKR